MAMDLGKDNLARGYYWLRILLYAYEWQCKMAGVQHGTKWAFEQPEAAKNINNAGSQNPSAAGADPDSPTIGVGTPHPQQHHETSSSMPGAQVPAGKTSGRGMTTGWPPGSESDKVRCFWEAYGVVKNCMINEIGNMSLVSALLVTLTWGIVITPEPLQLYTTVLTALFHVCVAASLVMSLYQLSLGLKTVWLFANAMTPLYIFKALVHCEFWCHECYGAFKWSLRFLIAAVFCWMVDVIARFAGTKTGTFVYLPAAIVSLILLVTGPILFSVRGTFLDRNVHPGYVHVHMQMSQSFIRREIKPIERLYVLMVDVIRAYGSADSWLPGTTPHTFDTIWRDLLWAMEHTVTWTDVHPVLGWLDRLPLVAVVPQVFGATWWWQHFAVRWHRKQAGRPRFGGATP